MRLIKISTLLAAGLLGHTAAQAQATVSFGPRLGLNLFTFSYSGTPQPLDETKSLVGVQVGGTANISFGKLAFQPSLIFTQKGAELKGSGKEVDGPFVTNYTATASPKLNFLELPLNFVYTFGEDHGIQVFAGPYVAMGVGGSGSYKVTLNSTDPVIAPFNGDYPGSLKVEYADKQNENSNAGNGNSTSPTLTVTVRKFDAGLNAGVGYRVGPLQAQLGYGLGLVNFVPKDTDGNDTGSTGYHRGVQLSATYFFSAK